MGKLQIAHLLPLATKILCQSPKKTATEDLFELVYRKIRSALIENNKTQLELIKQKGNLLLEKECMVRTMAASQNKQLEGES